MIVDYDASRKAGRVMTLASRGEWSAAVDEISRTDDDTLPIRTDYLAPGSRVSQWTGPFPVRRRRLSLEKSPRTTPSVDWGHPRISPHITAKRAEEAFQAAGWNVSIQFGDYTQEFWVIDENGFHGGFKSLTDLYRGMGWEDL